MCYASAFLRGKGGAVESQSAAKQAKALSANDGLMASAQDNRLTPQTGCYSMLSVFIGRLSKNVKFVTVSRDGSALRGCLCE